MKYLSHGTTASLLGFLLLLACITPASAREKIQQFHSDIAIGATGRLTITETLQVQSEGYRINHGIYRDLPIAGETPEGGINAGALEVLSAKLDDKPVPMHVARRDGYIRIYLGDSQTSIPRGRHSFELTYRTGPQIRQLENQDKLYWNVTGSYWAFPIDRASATIHLPEGAAATSLQGFTGPYGSTNSNAIRSSSSGDGTVDISTYQFLAPKEGLTVAVTFPQGFISEPGWQQRLWWTLRGSLGGTISVVGLIILGGFLFLSARWIKHTSHTHGEEPRVIERRKPPQGITPAQVQYIAQKRMVGHSAMIATILNLGLRGLMTIEPVGKAWRIILNKDAPKPDTLTLAPEEEALISGLQAEGGDILVERKNRKKLRRVFDNFSNALREEHGRKYYIWHGKWKLAAAILCTALASAIALTSLHDGAELLRYTPLAVIWLGLLMGALGAKGSSETLCNSLGSGLGAGLIPGCLMWLFIGLVEGALGWFAAIGLVATPILFWVFALRIGHPTPEGQAREAEIKGLKRYLERMGKARHANRSEREALPGLLPFAVALKMDSEWSTAFDRVLRSDDLYRFRNTIPLGLHSSFYSTGDSGSQIFDACQSLSTNLTSCISTTGSGSGGGFSGGGFSGGGGGGGGGGGW